MSQNKAEKKSKKNGLCSGQVDITYLTNMHYQSNQFDTGNYRVQHRFHDWSDILWNRLLLQIQTNKISCKEQTQLDSIFSAWALNC